MSDPLGQDPNPHQVPPPPPPPGQQWETGEGALRPGFDPRSVNRMDWGILACGLLAFIFSFVEYYTYSFGPLTGGENAWHGFFGWFAMLAALVGAAALAVGLFAPQVAPSLPYRMIALVAFGVAALCVILAGLIDARSVPSGISSGRGAGYYLSLIVILAGAVLAYLRTTDGKLPWQPGGNPFARRS